MFCADVTTASTHTQEQKKETEQNAVQTAKNVQFHMMIKCRFD